MTRAPTQAAFDLAGQYEKNVLTCYATDGSNTPSIGRGHTRGLTRADVGVKTITPDQSDILFHEDMFTAAESLEAQIGSDPVAAMTNNQHDALCDFVFNVGTIGPTLKGVLVAKRFDAVPAELARYVYAKGVKLTGLVRRRNAEIALWSTDEPGSADAEPSSADTRILATPPAVSSQAVSPLHRQPGFIAACTTAVCSAGAVAQPVVDTVKSGLSTVSDQIAPFSDNHHVASVHNLLLGLLAGLAVLSVVLMALKQRAARQESAGAPNNVAKPPPITAVPVVPQPQSEAA